ncbi:MAG TPA: AMP-binding protein [Methylobacter sp.]|jgi:acyl-CoA synthetase (AMP-forming)/AMP-acid ligase II/acyl carrier protein
MNKTFIDVLRSQADSLAEHTAYRFLVQGTVDGAIESISYAALLQRAKAIAAMLAGQGARGERVLLLYPSGLSFIEAFFGVLFAGATPVPMQTAKAGEQQAFIARLKRIAANAEARFVLTGTEGMQQATELPQLQWLSSDPIPLALAESWRDPNVNAKGSAFLQYTSGSTRQPRGVKISHANLIANCEAIGKAGFGHGLDALIVNWMPHYHDMGLVGGLLYPLFAGATSVLMSPQSFLRQPSRWLQAISHFQATSSGGANFAYALAVQRSTEDERSKLDLRSWEVAYCGAEPIRPGVLEQFADTFSHAGFNKKVFLPCYGMAETTLFVTGRKELVTLAVNRKALAEHRVELDDSEDAQFLVSCGRTADATQVRIIDPISVQELPGGQVGELWIKGPSVASGYFQHEQTDNPFNATLNGESGFLRSGDLGFLHAGELYICGRVKDLIIIRGQNNYPQDIEATVEAVDSLIMAGSVAAFPVQTNGIESFAVVVGVRSNKLDAQDLQTLALRIKTAIVESHELEPYAIVLVRSGEIPKTSSGKIRRSTCAAMWQQGEFTQLAQLGGAAAEHALYPNIVNALTKLDKRNTHYRFDLDQDIDWHRIHESGRYFPDSFLVNTGVDLTLLKTHPEAFAFYEWALALIICRRFVVLEEAVLVWGGQIRDIDAETRSLELLEIEEAKHIELFRRYTEILAAVHPHEAKELQTVRYVTLQEFLNWMLNTRNFQSTTEHHYMVWLGILFFEEYTVWIDEILKKLGSDVQPAWKQAHSCHRREEIQHVLTDYAYIQALDTSHEQRRLWSENFFTQNINALSQECHELIALTQARFPEIQQPLAMPVVGNALAFLRDRVFARTRLVAPYAEFLAGSGDSANAPCACPVSDSEQFTAWLHNTVAGLLQEDALKIPSAANFSQLGLDSLGHFSLASALEKQLGYSIPSNIAHSHSSIDALVNYFTAGNEEVISVTQGPDSTDLIPRVFNAEVPASAAQQQFLAYGLESAQPFHLYLIARLEGNVDRPALEQAIFQVVARHESLRTAFLSGKDGFVLSIAESELLPIELEDVAIIGNDFMAGVYARIERWNGQPFDPRNPPLWRLALMRSQSGDCVLVWLMHHLITDGWSNDIVRNELLESYQALRANRQIERPALTLQYSDICRREAEFLRTPEARRRLEWWLNQPATKAARLNPDREANPRRLIVNRHLPLSFKQALQESARFHQTTLGTLLLTVFSCMIGDRDGEGYVISRFHNRNTDTERQLAGFMVDGLLLPRQTQAGDFATALKQTQAAFNSALEHYLPLQYLTGELMGRSFLQQKRSLGPNLNFIPFTEQSANWQDIEVQSMTELSHVAPWYRTVLFVWLVRDGIGLSLSFDADEGRAAGEQLLDEFTARLQTVCDLVMDQILE